MTHHHRTAVTNSSELISVRLLWTGGWDSTFRLLSLISQADHVVQPYYIIDRDRRSWQIELATMKRIIEMCSEQRDKFPGVVLQPVTIEKDEIAPNHEISARYQRLSSRQHIGKQYEWLARYAEEHSFMDLEIGVERADCPATGALLDSLTFLDQESCQVRADVADDLLIFKYFSFPLAKISKKEMEKVSRDRGFGEIMEITWFCFNPINNKWPCGLCRPCKVTLMEGFSRRIGWRGTLERYKKKVQSIGSYWVRVGPKVREIAAAFHWLPETDNNKRAN